MESRSVKLIFWNRKARPSVLACDAVARDLEHFVFNVNIYVSNAESYYTAATNIPTFSKIWIAHRLRHREDKYVLKKSYRRSP